MTDGYQRMTSEQLRRLVAHEADEGAAAALERRDPTVEPSDRTADAYVDDLQYAVMPYDLLKHLALGGDAGAAEELRRRGLE